MDLLADQVVGATLAGLSTRRFRAGLEPVGDAVELKASQLSENSAKRPRRPSRSARCRWA